MAKVELDGVLGSSAQPRSNTYSCLSPSRCDLSHKPIGCPDPVGHGRRSPRSITTPGAPLATPVQPGVSVALVGCVVVDRGREGLLSATARGAVVGAVATVG